MWRCTVSVKKTTATSTFLSQRLKNTFQTHSGRLQLKPARSLNNNGVGNRRVILSRFLSPLITAVVAVTNVPHVPSPPLQRRNYRALRTSGKLHGTLTADSRVEGARLEKPCDPGSVFKMHVGIFASLNAEVIHMILCFNVGKRAKKTQKKRCYKGCFSWC